MVLAAGVDWVEAMENAGLENDGPNSGYCRVHTWHGLLPSMDVKAG